MPDQLFERPSRQRADRVEGHVAEQLHPDLVSEACVDWTPKSSSNQRFRNGPQSLGLATVGLTEADFVSLRMADDARLDHVRRKIGQRADDAPRLDGVRNDTTRVDPLEAKSLQ